jgi:hypothetical protein
MVKDREIYGYRDLEDRNYSSTIINWIPIVLIVIGIILASVYGSKLKNSDKKTDKNHNSYIGYLVLGIIILLIGLVGFIVSVNKIVN